MPSYQNVIFISILILVFYSCQNNTTKNTEKPPIKQVEYENLFLNLSPKMDTVIFNKRVKENPAIRDGNFILPLDDKNLTFKVSQEHDRISLKGSLKKLVLNSQRNSKESKKIISENEKIISRFLTFFEKYEPFPEEEFPISKNTKGRYETNTDRISEPILGVQKPRLADYGLFEDEYVLFKDAKKVIAVGFSNIGSIILSKPEMQQKINDLKSKERGDIKIKLDRIYYETILDSRDKNANDLKFGVTLEFNYFFISDFESIIINLKSDQLKYKTAKIKSDSIDKSQQDAIDRNKDKI